MKKKLYTAKILICTLGITFLLGLLPHETVAQTTGTVSGIVTDKDAETLAGVSVVVKGTAKSAITDIDGHYTVAGVTDNDVLVFSFLGFQSVEEPAGNRQQINVVMYESSINLDEVVVIGYGSMERRAVTTAVTSVKGDDLTTGMGGATIATALQGKISGLTISGTSSPNASNGFQLRGLASVNAGQGPLIVIDGIPGGDIRALNQEDVESVDVLKDASAGAIYGTRAAGGVILITTKQAKAGPVKLKYTGELSLESVRKRPQMLSSGEYLMYGLGDDYGSDTDWYNALLNDNPVSQRHLVNISGGSKNALIYATFMAQDQQGIVIGDGRTDYSGRLNTKFTLFDGKLEIKANAEYRQAERDQRNGVESFNMALSMNPTIPVYDDNDVSGYNVNGLGIFGTSYNPVADIMLKTYNGKDSWLLTDATLKLNITDDLSAQVTVGYQESKWQLYRYTSAYHKQSIDYSRQGEAHHSFSKDIRFSADAYLNYNKRFLNDHTINAVAGYSFWEANGENFNMTNYNFTIEGVGPWNMEDGTYLSEGRAGMVSHKDPRDRLLSLFARVNYAFKDKYMLSGSFRREGSSKFGENNRWGNFWALSAGWRLSDEQFIKDLGFIDDLKIRTGYGVTGNNGFGSGYTTRMYTSDVQMYPTPEGNWISTYGPIRNVNPDLKWEVKKELNIGFDFALFDSRLFGKFDIYQRRVDDLLFSVNAPMPPMTHATVMKNIGSLKNNGWEFELGGDVIRKKKLTYTTTMRFSQNKSEIVNMGEDGLYLDFMTFPSPGNPGDAVRLQNGSTIGQFFVYKYAGLDENGKWLIYDKDNNVVPAAGNTVVENKHYVGNAIPKLIISWDHNVRYKNFDASVSLRSYIDYDVFSQVNMYYGLVTPSQNNLLKDAYSRYYDINDEKILCDLFIYDATFLKIDAVSLGYTLDLSRYNRYLEKARIYFTARDLFIFTAYKGLNPEVNINGLTPGFEQIKDKDSMYPQTRRFTIGIQLTF